MTYYQKRKEELRQEAIQYQKDNSPKSWLDIAGATDYFIEFG